MVKAAYCAVQLLISHSSILGTQTLLSWGAQESQHRFLRSRELCNEWVTPSYPVRNIGVRCAVSVSLSCISTFLDNSKACLDPQGNHNTEVDVQALSFT